MAFVAHVVNGGKLAAPAPILKILTTNLEPNGTQTVRSVGTGPHSFNGNQNGVHSLIYWIGSELPFSTITWSLDSVTPVPPSTYPPNYPATYASQVALTDFMQQGAWATFAQFFPSVPGMSYVRNPDGAEVAGTRTSSQSNGPYTYNTYFTPPSPPNAPPHYHFRMGGASGTASFTFPGGRKKGLLTNYQGRLLPTWVAGDENLYWSEVTIGGGYDYRETLTWRVSIT